MGSLFAMSGIGILFALGYLVLAIFIIVYFFRIANDVRKLKETLDVIKNHIIKQDLKGSTENKTEFSNTQFEETITSKEAIVVEASDDNLKKLNELIKNQDKSLNYVSNFDFLDLLKNMINSKETARRVIERYYELFKTDLIEDLRSISVSYSDLTKTLSTFIEYKVVKSEYPHELIK